ncbi:hypothetical protein J0910_16895 [Nocardiopsis sp. CNT-189]|uniref:hypothetical protein n=1 Tax=Nocardiopsis oceanisediminis TaxID=2816862 RepID=UPI003B2E0BB5
MTDQLKVSLDTREDRTLRGHVHIHNPDTAYFPTEPEFAAQILMDAWPRPRHVLEEHPSAQDPSTADAMIKRLWDAFLGENVRTDADRHVLDPRTLRPREPRITVDDAYKGRLHPFGGTGSDTRSHTVQLAPAPERFAELTREIVLSYRLGAGRNLPNGADPRDLSGEELDELLDGPPETLPSAEFTIEVSDARYLEPLEVPRLISTAFTGGLPFMP